jgi:hypothetical protein
MGYQTRFDLSYDTKGQTRPQCEHVIPPKSKFCPTCGKQVRMIPLEEIIAAEILKHDDMKYAISDHCESKWYEYKDDMKKFSKLFPEVLFKLHGEGEEQGDIWDAYFLNGKWQEHKARIVIDEYDQKGWQK